MLRAGPAYSPYSMCIGNTVRLGQRSAMGSTIVAYRSPISPVSAAKHMPNTRHTLLMCIKSLAKFARLVKEAIDPGLRTYMQTYVTSRSVLLISFVRYAHLIHLYRNSSSDVLVIGTYRHHHTTSYTRKSYNFLIKRKQFCRISLVCVCAHVIPIFKVKVKFISLFIIQCCAAGPCSAVYYRYTTTCTLCVVHCRDSLCAVVDTISTLMIFKWQRTVDLCLSFLLA